MASLKKLKTPILSIIFVTCIFFSYFAFFTKPSTRPKIYDCFLFFNELELLEVRLNEMYDHVDKFVIVEACETFRGQPKPFFFAENRHLFEKFADKIIHITVSERLDTNNPWTRERQQREQILRGLKGCHKNDIIFISDVDEIVRGGCISEIVEQLSSKKLQAVVCNQKMYCGYLNRFQGDWHGTVCTSFKEVEKVSVKFIRKLRNMRPRTLRKTRISKICSIADGGWHFTSMGGVDRYIKKIESFSHTEFDTAEFKKRENLLKNIKAHRLVELDSSFPSFVIENRQYFEKIGFIDQSPLD
jgi:beta-1,4-mannosyl-glycoprotein beta-1,4-N-acetylglucosaminyltransferase